ncbi:IS5 family transposase [Methylocapsa sp. D3K7]|uniref:IS5 family transposase n=1 Tax=Methylocapsa sp. D3K7 TaxID=3041435 RepID=UPI00244EAA30|nr:IS5 family transposase [Methylocapsa sp. D3K7]WGJ15405.1 IS5 family transposase [Methylocapsa sp. D3K7]
MWTEQHRKIYQRVEKRYPSDMTDGEWVRLEPLIPPAKPGGRPRETNMREAINAILYLLRTGCPWRYLPREGFPPRSTVYNIFRNFQKAGTWDAIWERLHMDLREVMGREAIASAAIIDSRSLKSAEKGAVMTGLTGYDAGKKVKGRKIHALVDTQGLPMRIVIHSAGVQDRDGAAFVLDKIRNSFPWLELLWADSGYNAHQVDAAVAKVPSLRIEIVKRSDDMNGFVLLPRRWVVERTFSWFGRNRRLAKDWENLAATLQAFFALASIQIAIRRLAR